MVLMVWAKCWVYNGETCHTRMRRQQGGGGVMIWAGIIGDELVGPFRVPDGLKLTAATYCEFLKTALEPWLDDLPLSRLKRVVFMHDNAPSHAAKATTAVLKISWICKRVTNDLSSKLARFESHREHVVDS